MGWSTMVHRDYDLVIDSIAVSFRKVGHMAIALVMEFKGVGIDRYDAVIDALQLNGHMAKGGVFHVSGPTDDGVRIVDVWESQELLDAFLRDRLGPVMGQLQVPQPEVTVWPVHNILSEPFAG